MSPPSEAKLREENDALRALLRRERRARDYRSDVQTLLVETAEKVDPFGVAGVIARGFTDIVQTGWVVVAFLSADDPNTMEFVFGPTMPADVARDWKNAPLSTDVPMAAVLRGDLAAAELPDPSGFDRWPLFAAEADRADFASFYCLPIPSSDGTLPTAVIGLAWPDAHEIDDAERTLLADIISASAPAFERARRGAADRQVAETLQNWLLPPAISEHDHLDVASLYVPGRDELSVGGDWYDVVELGDFSSAFVIGDVVGHNVRAAAEMGQVRHVLASSLLSTSGDPALSLQQTDDYFTRRSPDTMATALVMVVDAAAGSVTIASAGHLPPILTDPSTASRLMRTEVGPPIGTGLGGYVSVVRELPAGTLLVAYTDGVVERRDEVIDDSLLDLCADIDREVGDQLGRGVTDFASAAVVSLLEQRARSEGADDDAAAIVLRLRHPNG